ncbi:MAG: hypothetical protein AAF081_07505 [Actinomycetota bacterium]
MQRRLDATHAAIAFAGLVIALVTEDLDRSYRFDEAIYASQFSASVDPLPWGPQRAPGMAWLVAPVTLATDSIVALRVWLGVVGAASGALAFAIWNRSVGVAAVVGHALFVASGVVIVFSTEAYPNLWLAYLALAAIGVAVGPWSSQRSVAAAVVLVALAAVFRPTEGLAVAMIVMVVVLARRRRDGVAPAGVISMGYLVGVTPWLIRSFTSFDGPLARLDEAGERAGAGLEFRLADTVWLLDNAHGNAGTGDSLSTAVGLWFGGLVVAGGIAVARTRPWSHPVVAAVGAVIVLAAPFAVLKAHPAPRFLLPGLAPLCLAAGFGLASVLRRRAAQVLMAFAATVLAVAQYGGYTELRDLATFRQARLETTGQELAALADGDDCVVLTRWGRAELAFASGCAWLGPPALPATSIEAGLHLDAAAAGDRVFAVTRSEADLPIGWIHHPFEVTADGTTWYVSELP